MVLYLTIIFFYPCSTFSLLFLSHSFVHYTFICSLVYSLPCLASWLDKSKYKLAYMEASNIFIVVEQRREEIDEIWLLCKQQVE